MLWLFRDRESTVANKKMGELLDAIQNQDKNTMIELFAPNALQQVSDVDAVIQELFTYCPYEVCSYDSWTGAGPRVEKEFHDGQTIELMYFTYDVQTTGGIYRFAVKYVSIDTECTENVGIWSVYVIDWDDDTDVSYAYLGDRQYTTGIHVGVQNVLPEVHSGTVPCPDASKETRPRE